MERAEASRTRALTYIHLYRGYSIGFKRIQSLNISPRHLMFRDGLLSPRSKLLPQSMSMYALEEEGNPDPSGSVLSFVSTGKPQYTINSARWGV